MSYIIFDNVNLTDEYGVSISGLETHRGPERDVSTVSVPGRSGDLHFDNGRYKNYLQPYLCFIREGFESKVSDLRNFLCERQGGYFRLEDSYHSDQFRKARFVGPFEPEVLTNNASAKFELNFDCEPYRYLKLNENGIEVLPGETITLFNEKAESYPYIVLEHAEGQDSLGNGFIEYIEYGDPDMRVFKSVKLDVDAYISEHSTSFTVICPNASIDTEISESYRLDILSINAMENMTKYLKYKKLDSTMSLVNCTSIADMNMPKVEKNVGVYVKVNYGSTKLGKATIYPRWRLL